MKKKTILFIKPGSNIRNQMWAIHHHAAECSRHDSIRVFFLSDNTETFNDRNITFINGYPPLLRFAHLIPVYLKRLYKLIENCRKLRPDIIHINNHIGAFSCLILIRIFLRRAIVVLDIRTLPDKKIKFLYYRMITSFFDWVFYLNQEILVKMIRNPRHSVLPLGFDPEIFSSSIVPSTFSDKKPLKCLYYGSLDRRRKLEILIKGFHSAIKSGISSHLTIIGEGSGRQALERTIEELGLQNRIRFLHQVPQSELIKYIRSHHLGISFVPQDKMYDCQLPLKAVEMLACGLPVLATNTEGNREVVKHKLNGFIVDADSNGINHGLQQIWEQGIPQTIYEHTSASVQHLTWEKIADNYLLNTYDRLFQSKYQNH